MITLAIVSLAALFIAILTFFCGFGLGTILMPVFALFFPVEVAIAATAVVHFLNNIFKLSLVGRYSHGPTVIRYGIPAAIAAAIGALVMEQLGHPAPLARYDLWGHECQVTLIKLIIALVIAGFAALELSPKFERTEIHPKWLWLGGLLSGFFGGLSGHQGALRSAFLMRAGLNRDQLVATRVAGAVIVDASRLIVYAAAAMLAAQHHDGPLRVLGQGDGWRLVIAATTAAFVGSFAGSRLVKKVTLKGLKRVVGVALFLLSGLLAAGIA